MWFQRDGIFDLGLKELDRQDYKSAVVSARIIVDLKIFFSEISCRFISVNSSRYSQTTTKPA